MKFCPSCGLEAEDNMVFCMNCGTKLQDKSKDIEKEEESEQPKIKTDKKSSTQWVWILLTFVFCVWAIAATVQCSEENDRKEYYIDEYWQLREKASELQAQVDFMDQYVVLVFDNGSNYYHTYECYEKHRGESFWAYNIDAAEGKEFEPCPDCH